MLGRGYSLKNEALSSFFFRWIVARERVGVGTCKVSRQKKGVSYPQKAATKKGIFVLFKGQVASEVTDVGRTKIMQTGRIREKGGSIGEGKEGGILFKPPQPKDPSQWLSWPGQTISSNNFTLDLINHGYRIELAGCPPQKFLPTLLPREQDKAVAMSSLLQNMLEQDVISYIPPNQRKGRR